MIVVSEVDALWGRNTPFDEYTKLHAMTNKDKSPDELAFIVESLVLTMRLNVPEGQLPDVPSRASLVSKSGDLACIQMTRGVVLHLAKLKCKSWERLRHNRLRTIRGVLIWF